MSWLPAGPCVTSLPKGATLPSVAFVSLGARLPSQSRRSGQTLGPWFSLVSRPIVAVLPFVSRFTLKPNFSFPAVGATFTCGDRDSGSGYHTSCKGSIYYQPSK